MPETTAVDVLFVAYRSLRDEEKEGLHEAVSQERFERQLGQEHELAGFLGSMRRAAELAACDPADLTVTQYREVSKGRKDLRPLSQLLKRFGSWRQAKDALELSKDHSLRQVDLRLSQRQLKGKVWRYSEQTLKTFFAEAVEHYGGRVPMASELDAYRERCLEIAKAKGEQGRHFPQAGAYRRRWGTYEKACLAMGYTPDHVAERLERGRTADRGGTHLG
jgi:hypothetical protein